MDGMQTAAGRRTSWRASVVGVVVGVLAAVALAGCGVGEPRKVGPSGVDGLVVPSPAPDPSDFVAGVDNPWLPLAEGSRWRYRVVEDGEVVRRTTVRVTGREHEVAGVPVTEVREVVREVRRSGRGRLVEETLAWFAQDVDGNVWHLGRETTSYDGRKPSTAGSWQVGVDGAAAGLAMPATPRIGDGFEREAAGGVAEDRARVLAVEGEVTVPAGTFTAVVELEGSSPLEPGVVTRSVYARGEGLLRRAMVSGGTEVVELVARTTPVPE